MNDSTQNKNGQVAAIYARSAAKNSTGVREQQRICADAARQDGFATPDEFRFVDDGWSGATVDRPALQRLMDLVMNGEAQFERVYVWDRSRLGRFSDPRHHFFIEVVLQEHGVEVRYANERRINWQDMEGLGDLDAIKAFVDSSRAAERERSVARVGDRSAGPSGGATLEPFTLGNRAVCAHCEGRLIGFRRPVGKDGTRSRYYRHPTRRPARRAGKEERTKMDPGLCRFSGQYFRAEPIEEAVDDALAKESGDTFSSNPGRGVAAAGPRICFDPQEGRVALGDLPVESESDSRRADTTE